MLYSFILTLMLFSQHGYAQGLQCYECKYEEVNGSTEPQSDDKESCYSGTALNRMRCSDNPRPLQDGQIYRCHTAVYQKTMANGDIGNGVSRGCLAVDKLTYGSIQSTSSNDDIVELFGRWSTDDVTGTFDFCDTEYCNDGYSTAEQAELKQLTEAKRDGFMKCMGDTSHCSGHGECQDMVGRGDFSCVCDDGWKGTLCNEPAGVSRSLEMLLRAYLKERH